MAADVDSRARRSGAYGLRIIGLDDATHLLVDAGSDWPELEIVTERGSIAGLRERVGEDEATVVLLGAVAFLRRQPARAVFRFETEPGADALVHPYLAPIAGLFSHWL